MVQYGTIWYNFAKQVLPKHNGARCPLPTDSGVEYLAETYIYDNFGNSCANYKLGWSGLTKGNIMTD